MMKSLEANIARAVSFEIGALEGELNAVVMHVEHVPLTDAAAEATPGVFALILDRAQAADLKRQLLNALGWFGPGPSRAAH
ncbi:hypothetical protein [Achromobacter piechaudii]|uniref:hypothetical protein n=1 Tax=Achromobacter piechaudii TaxID=72556 RepID=UPI000B21329E|nr:hypothetical protein [Achromobacter piechaudii]